MKGRRQNRKAAPFSLARRGADNGTMRTRHAAVFSALILLAGTLPAQELLRGQVFVDLEPVYALSPALPYPLDAENVRRRALEEASLFFQSMIYGWDFSYTAGERARGIAENLAMERRGEIAFGDSRLRVTDARLDGQRFSVWADYRLSDGQRRRMEQWGAGQSRNVQALGHADLAPPGGAFGAASENGAAGNGGGTDETGAWLAGQQAALEDAARAGIRAMLRGQERNRPRVLRGRIALAGFPRFYFDRGRWAAAARFRVEMLELEPFAAY